MTFSRQQTKLNVVPFGNVVQPFESFKSLIALAIFVFNGLLPPPSVVGRQLNVGLTTFKERSQPEQFNRGSRYAPKQYIGNERDQQFHPQPLPPISADWLSATNGPNIQGVDFDLVQPSNSDNNDQYRQTFIAAIGSDNSFSSGRDATVVELVSVPTSSSSTDHHAAVKPPVSFGYQFPSHSHRNDIVRSSSSSSRNKRVLKTYGSQPQPQQQQQQQQSYQLLALPLAPAMIPSPAPMPSHRPSYMPPAPPPPAPVYPPPPSPSYSPPAPSPPVSSPAPAPNTMVYLLVPAQQPASSPASAPSLSSYPMNSMSPPPAAPAYPSMMPAMMTSGYGAAQQQPPPSTSYPSMMPAMMTSGYGAAQQQPPPSTSYPSMMPAMMTSVYGAAQQQPPPSTSYPSPSQTPPSPSMTSGSTYQTPMPSSTSQQTSSGSALYVLIPSSAPASPAGHQQAAMSSAQPVMMMVTSHSGYGQSAPAPTCPEVPGQFCYGKYPGHYQHPTTNTCYILCDEFGSGFAKPCAPGTSWIARHGDSAASGSGFNRCV